MGGITRPYHRRRRLLACCLTAICTLITLALLGVAVPALADTPAPSDTTTGSDAPPDEPGNPTQAALLQAAATGQPVPVSSLTTQTSTTTANPDGTLTSTTYTQPVRVLQAGTWTPVDATLGRNSDGTYSPAATPSAVALSGGGNGPLATFTDSAGHTLALTMPFTLPAPTVSGDTATYADVLSGVDLQATVTDQGGFSDSLIVHDATAAANPALKTLTLATSISGLTLTPGDSGGFTATSTDGTPSFTVPPPEMWDSTNTTTTTPSTLHTQRMTDASDQPTDTQPGTGVPATSSPAGPGADAHVAPVSMTVGANALTLSPDVGMLTNPDTTWPVYIDPGVTTNTTGHYTETQEGCSSPQYDTPQTNGEGIGYQQFSSNCFGLEESFYQMDISKLTSSMDITDAELHLTETWGADAGCSNTWPLTVQATSSFNSSTNWSSRPTPNNTFSKTVQMTSANIASGCGDRDATIPVTGAISDLANKGTKSWTIGLYGDESKTSSNFGFMRFSVNPYIQTTYDIAPNQPTALSTTPSAEPSTHDCDGGTPGYIGATRLINGDTSNITLNAKLTSNISGENVKGDFSTWDDQTADSSGDPNPIASPSSTYVASGTTVHANFGTAVKDGHEYGWQIRAYDGTQYSPWTPVCHFTVDLTPPTQATTTTSTDFPPVGSGQDPTKYAGQSGSLTVTSQDPVPTGCTRGTCQASGVDHFDYSLDQPIPTQGATSVPATTTNGIATATVPLTPTTWGTHVLYVSAVDAAGNSTTLPTTYTFYAPWNPTTMVAPGDLTADGIPDLLGTDKTGDLTLLNGNSDPAIPPASHIAATPNDSPDHTSWNTYLTAHRGSIVNQGVDDLFALKKGTNNFYIYENDADSDGTPGHFTLRQDLIGTLARPECVATDTASGRNGNAHNCDTSGAPYESDWSKVTQMIAPGDVNSDHKPDLITVEDGNLWLYRGSSQQNSFFGPSAGATADTTPILLGTGDWSHYTLIAPGDVGSTPTLWARDNNSGTIYSYPLTPDSDGLPPMLTAPNSAGSSAATLPITLPAGAYPQIASPGDINSPTANGNPDGNPDLYATTPDGQLIEYPGSAPTGTTANFANPVTLGYASTPTDWWPLSQNSGSVASDAGQTGNDATLFNGAAWASDPNHGNVLGLNGTDGYASSKTCAVNTDLFSPDTESFVNTSFSVSAWVKLNDLTTNSTFVSQSDDPSIGAANGFQLYYSSGRGVWAFDRHNDDTTSTSFTAAYGAKAQSNTWTHLVGVYDAPSNTLNLYVNGALSASETFAGTPWNATGPVQIGRRLYQGTYGEYAHAQISDVQIYNTALEPTAVAALNDSPLLTQLS